MRSVFLLEVSKDPVAHVRIPDGKAQQESRDPGKRARWLVHLWIPAQLSSSSDSYPTQRFLKARPDVLSASRPADVIAK